MIVRLALAAALAGAASPAPEGPAPAAPASPTRRPRPPAPVPSPDPNAAGPGRPRNEPIQVPGASAPPPGSETPAAPAGVRENEQGEIEPDARETEPGGAPRVPAPRELSPFSAGPPKHVSEDRMSALGLTRRRDGTMLYVDPGKRFTATLGPDGTVRFGDRWNRDQHGHKMPGSRPALRQLNAAGLGIAGPAEWLLTLQDRMGGPERHAAAKREFLDRTRDLRTELAIAWTLELLRDRIGALERELFDLWSGPGTAAARRELLFQRWDECDEAFAGLGPEGDITPEAMSAIDKARVETAERARRIIEAFVRRHLPQGSPDAYTPAEIADMNRRRVSRQDFQPYVPRE
ncbi:MAG TPA: hypothetical protein VIK91_04675 [Nannocystis sp.]